MPRVNQIDRRVPVKLLVGSQSRSYQAVQVYLPAELEAFVQQLVDSGAYCAPSEVIHDALWLLKDQADLYRIKLAELRKLIAVGIEQADRGELIDGEIVFAKLWEKIQTGKRP